MASLLGFPNPVDEHAARTVATGVVVLTALILVLPVPWLTVLLAAGFWARVLTGPKLSPLGQFATKVVAPRFAAPKLTPGPPKRFAQGIGAACSAAALVAWPLFGWTVASWILVLLLVAASLEAFAGFCLGCFIFARLMRVGLIPDSVCVACADLSKRPAATAPSS